MQNLVDTRGCSSTSLRHNHFRTMSSKRAYGRRLQGNASIVMPMTKHWKGYLIGKHIWLQCFLRCFPPRDSSTPRHRLNSSTFIIINCSDLIRTHCKPSRMYQNHIHYILLEYNQKWYGTKSTVSAAQNEIRCLPEVIGTIVRADDCHQWCYQQYGALVLQPKVYIWKTCTVQLGGQFFGKYTDLWLHGLLTSIWDSRYLAFNEEFPFLCVRWISWAKPPRRAPLLLFFCSVTSHNELVSSITIENNAIPFARITPHYIVTMAC